jgi:hypothetical protein
VCDYLELGIGRSDVESKLGDRKLDLYKSQNDRYGLGGCPDEAPFLFLGPALVTAETLPAILPLTRIETLYGSRY